MDLPIVTNEEKCSREKIISYLDAELSPQEEIVLEKHIAECRNCLSELNLQKQMLFALDSAFGEKTGIELPKDFAKVVATRAETDVKGLRSKSEQFRALFFCSILLLIVVAGLGVTTAFSGIGKFGEQLFVVITFLGHLFYDLMVGVTVILRSFGKQPVFNSAIILFLAAIIFVVFAISFFKYSDNSNRS